jgi:hypothetical protein
VSVDFVEHTLLIQTSEGTSKALGLFPPSQRARPGGHDQPATGTAVQLLLAYAVVAGAFFFHD